MTAALTPGARFDTLVVGAFNRLAVTAARAVAESPGGVYNPLFVYARPGLGKTHLLMAIGHAALEINPRLAVEYVTLDALVEGFRAALAAGQGEAYRRRFADVDLLLVDDVQFLSGQREVQAELLRIVDAMQTASRQIVLTSDRPPAEIEALDERLIRRFAGGLVIDIAAPDYETRVAILRRKSDERRLGFGPGVLEAVAQIEIDNVRELVGALNRLVAYQAAEDVVLEPERVREILRGGRSGAAGPAAPAAAVIDAFLSEVSATLSQQIETWRQRVAAAILRWEGEGFRTGRLEALLDGDLTRDPEEVLREFEADVRRLEALRAEAVALSPEVAGSPVFRDPADLAAAEELLARLRSGATPPPAPSPAWRLEALAEGPSNRIAIQAARAVAASPGRKYNPLVVVGGSGVGKTHLLHGLGTALVLGGMGSVACLGAAEFTAELIDAIGRDGVTQWRERFRRVDALLLDDVHLLAGKDRSQDELFLLFNHLIERGRQMAFTSAVPLSQLSGIEARLLTRLEGGLVVELAPPDREVRRQVVERFLQDKVSAVEPEVVDYLAGRPADSVRSVHGLVQRVLSAAEAQQTQPTLAIARTVVEGVPARAPRRSGPVARPAGAAPAAGALASREKMVWDWPGIGERVLEEWR